MPKTLMERAGLSTIGCACQPFGQLFFFGNAVADGDRRGQVPAERSLTQFRFVEIAEHFDGRKGLARVRFQRDRVAALDKSFLDDAAVESGALGRTEALDKGGVADAGGQ